MAPTLDAVQPDAEAVDDKSKKRGFPSDGLDDIELRNVRLSLSHRRSLVEDGSAGTKQLVDTPHGLISIAVAGDRSKPVIITYHDLGMNHVTNFQGFMNYPEMRQLTSVFCVVHVNAPGQEEGAQTLPEGYVYPTIEELSETLSYVKTHLGIHSFTGFGVGLGANVLARHAIKYPNDVYSFWAIRVQYVKLEDGMILGNTRLYLIGWNKVDALVLINCSSTQAGWIEWGYQKVNVRHLRAGTMTSGTVDYLLWHHFGKVESCNQDLVTVYKQHFERSLNAANLGLLIDSYIRRSDLCIVREMDPNKKKDVRMIRCPILNVTSNFSPHVEDTVTFNGKLDPTLSNWMKIQDCGLVIDENPGKIVEAFRLFLQGQGYALTGSRRSSSVSVGGEGKSR